MKLLSQVNSPVDLKKLKIDELVTYSGELRQYMIDVMSKIGGHVAANLGVVELSAALHYVFETPSDKIVWDVGHQCYAHKIITGRRDQFPTIRQEGGISGFTKISESEYDVFGAGHSSTSVSAGLGVAEAEWQLGTNNQVVTVIGDGALTAGMAYEGLNHAGHLRRPNYIIIFNDNEMSISENVGALAKFFGRRINSSIYNKIRAEVKSALKLVSTKDVDVFEKAKLLTSAVKDLFSAASFFEAMGFRYVGPIDGNNIQELVDSLKAVKELSLNAMRAARENSNNPDFEVDPPIVVHVKTKKGLGLQSAENRPGDFHGVTGFCMQTGEPTKKAASAPTYTAIFSQTICRLAESDDKLVAVTAAMPEGTGLHKFQKQYPERFYDVGIAEQHAVTFSAAMRLKGLRPITAIYSTFMQRAYDQLIHDAAIQNIPMALFLDRGGLVGADGATHNGVFDMSFLRCVPGMVLMAPKDENELQHMVYTALYCDKLASVRFPRGNGVGVALDSKLQMLPIGKAERLMPILKGAQDPDVIIWAAGSCVHPSIKAAQELNALGIDAEVVNARFIKPLDEETLLSDAGRAKLIVTVEENSIVGGLGSAVLECLSKNQILIPTITLGVPDRFIHHGNPDRLKSECGFDQRGIVGAVSKFFEKSSRIRKPKHTQIQHIPAH